MSAQPVDLALSRPAASPQPRTGPPAPGPRGRRAPTTPGSSTTSPTRRDPLRRQVLIVTRTGAGERGEHAARRRADDTVRALSGLGVTTRALDGAAATAALAAAADPYRPPRPGGLAAPDTVITARHPVERGPRREDTHDTHVPTKRPTTTAEPARRPQAGGRGRARLGRGHPAVAAGRGRLRRHPGRHRLPGRGRPGLAGAAAVLARPARRGPAHRPAPGAGRRGPAAHASAPGSNRPGALDADRGQLADPGVEAAADDAADLADRLARGAAKLFRVGLYLTVHARTEDELARGRARR